jgi:GH43 family beta-xylosidase
MHKAPNGKWYIYTSGSVSPIPGTKKCIFVLEGPSDDPFEGDWTFCGIPLADISSIDPTIYTAPDKKQYICYSRTGTEHGQILEIRDLINPYTYGDGYAIIAQAELDWELTPPYVGIRAIVEGPFFVEKNGRLFIIYSANGCWSDNYGLGVLEHMGGSLCDAKNWKKHDKPILVPGNGVFGPGHASFFKSPDGKELWCAYHGMKNHNESATVLPRYFNVQPITFDDTGFPVIGVPVGYDTELNSPSGEVF